MKSELNSLFTDEQLQSIFRCSPDSVKIYHSRYNTIFSILKDKAPLYSNKKWMTRPYPWHFTNFPDGIKDALEEAIKPDGDQYSDNTKRSWYMLIMSLKPYVEKKLGMKSEKSIYSSSVYQRRIHELESAYLNREKPKEVTVEEIRGNLHKLGANSMERVLIELYLGGVTLRDDFQLEFVKKIEDVEHDGKTNYLVLVKPGFDIYLQKSKNVSHAKKQKPRIYKLSTELSTVVAAYLLSLKPDKRKFPFGRAKHYKRIGQALTLMGVKDGNRSINLLRSAVADHAAKTKDSGMIGETAYNSLHTVATSHVYETSKN